MLVVFPPLQKKHQRQSASDFNIDTKMHHRATKEAPLPNAEVTTV